MTKVTMHNVYKALAVLVLGVVLSGNACADQGTRLGSHVGWHVRQPTRFIVSGVLRKDGSTDVIKPIHAILVAEGAEAAVTQFARSAQKQYPGYTLISTLASPVPAIGTCENII